MIQDFKFLDKLPKIIPLISLLFFLGSLFYEGLHFGSFGVNIFSFISLGETLNLFIDKLPLMIIISAGVFLFFFIFQLFLHEKLIRLFHTVRYNRRFRSKRQAQHNLILTFIFLIPMMFYMGAFFPSFLIKHYRTEEFLLLRAFIVLLNVFWFFNLSLSYSKDRNEINYFQLKPAVFTFIITFFCVIYYFHRWEILKMKEKYDNRSSYNPKEKYFKIKLQNNEIISEDSAVFVGNTNNYLFLHYPNKFKDLSETRIIKMDDVHEIFVSKYMRWYNNFP